MKPCKHPCCPDTGPCKKAKVKPKYRTNRYSVKRQKINKTYSACSKLFISAKPECEIKSPECTHYSQGVHHKKGRGIFLLDETTWLASCNACNRYVEQNDKWARDNGFKESKLMSRRVLD